MKAPKLLKKPLLIIQILAFALSPFAQVAHASEDTADQAFLTTEVTQTDQGPVYIEVQTFNIKNNTDLDEARNEISKKIQGQSKVREQFVLNLESPDHNSTPLDIQADKVASELSKNIDSEKLTQPNKIIVEKPLGFFKRHYNLSLGLIRLVLNGGTVAAGLMVGHGIPMEHALFIGSLAGALSATVQIKSDVVYKWMTNSVLLAKSAKHAGLLPASDADQISKAEKALNEVEKYGKWSSIELAFLLICRTAMTVLNIPVTENIFTTAAKSLVSQGFYEIGLLRASEQLGKINPAWTGKATVFKNVALFAGSSISVLAAIGSMIGMPLSNLGFVVLASTGAILNFSPKILSTQPVKKILNRWKTPSPTKCRDLFNDAA